jgi:hypothetical protein
MCRTPPRLTNPTTLASGDASSKQREIDHGVLLNFIERRVCELRLYGVLRSSL